MTQLDFNFDKALPPNPYQWGTGNYRVYEWIEKYRQILLSEIHNVLHCETARLRCDIKPFLKKHGFDVLCEYVREGERLYRIVEV